MHGMAAQDGCPGRLIEACTVDMKFEQSDRASNSYHTIALLKAFCP
jgi:hypothetical protein